MKKIKFLIVALTTIFGLKAMQQGSSSSSTGNQDVQAILRALQALQQDNERMRQELAQLRTQQNQQASFSQPPQPAQSSQAIVQPASNQDINRIAQAVAAQLRQGQGDIVLEPRQQSLARALLNVNSDARVVKATIDPDDVDAQEMVKFTEDFFKLLNLAAANIGPWLKTLDESLKNSFPDEYQKKIKK